MSDRPFNRRDFLKLAGFAAGGLALRPLDKALPNFDKLTFTENPITLGNLTLTPILTEHDEKTWVENGSKLLEQLKPFSTVIPEYYPPEYTNLTNKNPLLKIYDSSNYAFKKIAAYCSNNHKEVYVVDPYYSEDAIKLHFSMTNSPLILAGTAGLAIANGAIKAIQISEEIKKRDNGLTSGQEASRNISKKIFGGILQIGSLGAAGTLQATNFSTKEEIDFRRVFVARGLKIVGNTLLQKTQAAIIYPKEHWEWSVQDNLPGILYYLTHPAEHEKQIAMYESEYAQKDYPDLYKIRHY